MSNIVLVTLRVFFMSWNPKTNSTGKAGVRDPSLPVVSQYESLQLRVVYRFS